MTIDEKRASRQTESDRTTSASDFPPKSYPIGTAGVRWGFAELSAWQSLQVHRRRYETDVLQRIEELRARFDVVSYGELTVDAKRFPLLAIRSPEWNEVLPIALVTGGVHGYETSGVLGALQFLSQDAEDYAGKVNLLVAPCVSPWSYETIQRWNVQAVDPNRSFFDDSPAEESAALLRLVRPVRNRILVHVDLHETTDSDESEFRPALAARDGRAHVPGTIPDGFYVVDDTELPQTDFQRAVIDAVSRVTHIAPADADGKIIGSSVVAPGVIQYPLRSLGLCAGITGARFRTTTEVYPDSPRSNDAICIAAQVAAVRAALDYALMHASDGDVS